MTPQDQRQALTDVQRAKGIQQMLDAGVSATRSPRFTGLVAVFGQRAMVCRLERDRSGSASPP